MKRPITLYLAVIVAVLCFGGMLGAGYITVVAWNPPPWPLAFRLLAPAYTGVMAVAGIMLLVTAWREVRA